MKPTRLFLFLFLLSLPMLQSPADELSSGLSSPPVPSSGFVSAMPAHEITVSAGRPAQVKLGFTIKSGYHINSNHPNSD
ncbi:MAG TPA: hypothetical protein VFA71_09290, partial [Terriglobales bacterium]|nr:hypothetical protein [Terriglobales bacterium]